MKNEIRKSKNEKHNTTKRIKKWKMKMEKKNENKKGKIVVQKSNIYSGKKKRKFNVNYFCKIN